MRRLLVLLCALLILSCGNSPRLLWKFKTGGRIYGSPVVANQRLISGSADSVLYSIDLKTGREVWSKKFDAPFFASPVFRNNTLYVGTGKGDLVAIDPANGSERWSFPTGNVIEYVPCMDEQSLYFGNNRGEFYRVGFDGAVLWKHPLKGKFSGTCQVRDNLVYTSCWNKNFYALDRSTGEVAWQQTSGTLNFTGPTFQGKRVWFSSHEHIFCFDAVSGEVQFTRETHYMNSLIEWEGTLWTLEKDRLCKRDADGNLVSAMHFNAGPISPVSLNHVLMIGDYKDTLYGVTADSKIIWKFEGGGVFTAGVLNAGVYYAGNMDGNIYAIRLPQ